MMLLMMLCFFQNQRFCCFCHLRDVHVWIPCKLNSWFHIPERWAVLITIQNPTICSHVCNYSPGYLFELPSSDLPIMDLDRWQAASAFQTALDINDHALSLECHNDASHDAVFLSKPTVLLLLSFESMFTYESHESSTRDFRCQSVESYWSQHKIPPFAHMSAMTRQDICLSFRLRTCP